MSKIIDIARMYIGKQETLGQNDGPVIRTMKQGLGLPMTPMSWCGIFVGWCIMRSNQMLTRTDLRKALGFESPFYVESTRDWLAQAEKRGMTTVNPDPGDLFVLLDAHGNAHHIGFVTSEVCDTSGVFSTIEGNTNEGGSNNGDGVYERRRSAIRGVEFIRLPKELKA